MLKYLWTLLTTTNPKLFYKKLLLNITIIFIIYYLYRISEPPKKELEGFSQEAPFVLKTDLEIYDDFYAEVYDGITERPTSCQRELYDIIKSTDPDTKNSVFLDIGCGTGCVVNELTEAGYTAYGVDKSTAMIDFAQAKYVNCGFIKGDINDTMTFEKSLFTHIICSNFTIYEIPDKQLFFRNCYNWMKPNGYLVLHLIDREKFSAKQFKDSIMDLSSLYRALTPEKKERSLNTSIEFIDFVYDAVYVIKPQSDKVTFKETFTDKETKHVRQNENTLTIEPINKILDIASKSGFIIHGKTNKYNGDENQYLYILERTL